VANPTSCGLADGYSCVIATSSTSATVLLNAGKQYSIGHDGEDNAGNPGITATVYGALTMRGDASTITVDADSSEGPNKFKLIAGRALLLPPGVSSIKLKTSVVTGPTVTLMVGRQSGL
jgi:hypothetical protein